MKIIDSKNAPKAIGPYSQAIELSNGLMFLSGQLGLVPETMELEKGIEAQTNQILKNIENVLKEAGYEKNNVVKTTILLSDINDFTVVNEIYGKFFEDHKPARSTFAVKALPKNALIEIEAIAHK
ncbi:2-iminobutanoate/2-iminopropanoate deaminase [Spiroplasma litorale]|uniref:2-iminobutanoate/2-iminopropanoate deaminase n=1 Tax=Spiroplasma litorale TaxID=216942 RepID=A0A0K1W2U7_9MOLU|nr:RidA family protein [Spiroplasma litorale]AKX34501.1 2-iminobutanoate/2-iminopropanoate deaminase [Spiroplasma litorale]